MGEWGGIFQKPLSPLALESIYGSAEVDHPAPARIHSSRRVIKQRVNGGVVDVLENTTRPSSVPTTRRSLTKAVRSLTTKAVNYITTRSNFYGNAPPRGFILVT